MAIFNEQELLALGLSRPAMHALRESVDNATGPVTLEELRTLVTAINTRGGEIRRLSQRLDALEQRLAATPSGDAGRLAQRVARLEALAAAHTLPDTDNLRRRVDALEALQWQ